MQRAFDQFKNSIKYVKELDVLYNYLKNDLHLPDDLTDFLLRAEWIYAVSAMDKLIHELVRIGMIEAFQGRRIRTGKFLSFGVTAKTLTSSLSAAEPPPEYWFEQEVIEKHKTLSFQTPEKIAEALSLIWDEPHKWQRLAASAGTTQADLTAQLKVIISRRNQMVHEADLDLLSGIRNSIDKAGIDEVVPFIEKLSEKIFRACS